MGIGNITDESGRVLGSDGKPKARVSIGRIVGFDQFGSKVSDDVQSKQLIEDPFSEIPGYGQTIRIPPFQLEQLVLLAEQVPVHSSCIQQQMMDVIGDGPRWIHDTNKASSKVDPKATKIDKWLGSLCDEFTLLETLQAWYDDYKTLGWGFLEVARDASGRVRRLYHVPAHTIRAHYTNTMFAQIRHGRIVWFKKWGIPGDIYAATGRPCPPGTPNAMRANELLVLRRPTRRSTWYGVPGYLPAIGYITLAVSARDWNILFFENYREPRHLIVVTGFEEDVNKVTDDLIDTLESQGNDPHRNLVLPVSGNASVHIEKLAVPGQDLDFEKLIDKADFEILMSHRVPADRIGVSHISGLVGGSPAAVIQTINQIYKEGNVAKDQGVVEDRLDKFVRVEYPKATGEDCEYHADFKELDVEDAGAASDVVKGLVSTAVITINEGRKRIGELPLKKFVGEDGIDMTLPEYLKSIGVSSPAHTGIQFLSPSLLNVDGTFSDEPNPDVVGPGPEEGQGAKSSKTQFPINKQGKKKVPGVGPSKSGNQPAPPKSPAQQRMQKMADLYNEPASLGHIAEMGAAFGELQAQVEELLREQTS